MIARTPSADFLRGGIFPKTFFRSLMELEPLQQPEVNQALLTEILTTQPLVWAKTFCPNHHKLPTPFFHPEIMKLLMVHRHVAIGAPRESAKSTLVNFDYVAHAIVFKRKSFIVILSNPFKKGAAYLDGIKREFGENELLKEAFPPIKIVKDAEGDSIFRHRDGFEVKVLCKGVEQIGTIRGLKFKYSRPDLIILDDIEDDEMVKNSERRAELQRNFDEAVVPAGEMGKCQYIAIGTILHDDSLLAKILSPHKYPEYKKVIYRAGLNWDNKGRRESLWRDKWTVPWLEQLEREKPTVFAKEYQNDPASGSNVRFERRDFRYWRNEQGRYVLFGPENEVISSGLLRDCRAAIACDLAWKEKRSADSTVILPGYLTPDSNILIEDYVNKIGMRPDEFIEQIFLMVERLERLTHANVPVGFEKAMLENVTQWMMRKDMRRRNKFLVTKELVWDADKETRIEMRLQPRYSQHAIFHKQGMGDLEQQLMRFPSATHDDLIDAAQGLVQLLKFPKGIKNEEEPQDAFEWWQKQIAKSKKKIFSPFNGSNRGHYELPSQESFQ